MKTVEQWQWLVTDPVRGGRPYKTRFTMDEATALDLYPDAVRVPGSMELRKQCETDADRASTLNTKPGMLRSKAA